MAVLAWENDLRRHTAEAARDLECLDLLLVAPAPAPAQQQQQQQPRRSPEPTATSVWQRALRLAGRLARVACALSVRLHDVQSGERIEGLLVAFERLSIATATGGRATRKNIWRALPGRNAVLRDLAADIRLALARLRATLRLGGADAITTTTTTTAMTVLLLASDEEHGRLMARCTDLLVAAKGLLHLVYEDLTVVVGGAELRDTRQAWLKARAPLAEGIEAFALEAFTCI